VKETEQKIMLDRLIRKWNQLGLVLTGDNWIIQQVLQWTPLKSLWGEGYQRRSRKNIWRNADCRFQVQLE